jgi:acetylornithine deacetylase/succinyl-diaminopimelate desuccinylase-like protein
MPTIFIAAFSHMRQRSPVQTGAAHHGPATYPRVEIAAHDITGLRVHTDFSMSWRRNHRGPMKLCISFVLLLALAPACAPGASPRPAAPGQGQATPGPGSAAGHATMPAEPSCTPARGLDAQAITDEAACLLGQYLRIDTTNPPGNEIAGARFLAAVLARDGIESRIIEAAPGRASLYARLRARGGHAGAHRGAVALLSHIDVVPAVAREWTHAPFAGEVADGFLWGRGAVDTKGLGIVQLMTVLLLARMDVPLDRDVIFLAVADEESGGSQGARHLLAEHFDLVQDVAHVLNEGGGILRESDGRLRYGVELAQKAPLWLAIEARGEPGHASNPRPDSASDRLVRGLARLSAHEFPILVVPAVQAMYTQLADTLPAEQAARYRDLQASLRDPGFRATFLAQGSNNALVRNTVAITMLSGSDKENVIPSTARAVLDVRILPGQKPEAVISTIRQVMAEPSLTIEPVLSWAPHPSPADTTLYRAIAALAARHHPEARVLGSVLTGFTDCNAFRSKGISCHGFSPIEIAVRELLRVHGRDERIRVDALGSGVLLLYDLLVRDLPAADSP